MKIIFMDRYTSPISYFWGAICTLLGALSLNDVAIISGIILSIATFCYNIYHKRQIRKLLAKKKWVNSDEETD